MNTADVAAAYCIADQGQVIVRLASFDWDFERYGPVDLVIGSNEIRMRYVGSGNLEGQATLLLERCERSPTIGEIETALKDQDGGIRVVRTD